MSTLRSRGPRRRYHRCPAPVKPLLTGKDVLHVIIYLGIAVTMLCFAASSLLQLAR